MRKIGKTRKGFTLVEMVLVIAIIVILAGVLVIGIGTYLNRAMATTSSLNSHNSSIISITEEVERQMGIDGEDGEGEGA
ncbi:MAG: type II secretion system GspH family protein [Saccharofermentans sp.]|nr:type II secretion system GspH family protein [Saccharofermentans sp.]